jgi:SagB-type dehydrogenase family enzyme
MRIKTPTGSAPPPPVSALRPERFSDLQGPRVVLPLASTGWTATLQEVFTRRRSIRDYSEKPLTLDQTARLLWAAQGVTGLGGLRTAPSAGAIYPLRTYLLAFQIKDLPKGLYRYEPDAHELCTLGRGDRRKRMVRAADGQECANQCAAMVVLAADLRRMTREYGDAAQTLALLEAGHIAQNLLLAATALGLGAICLGKTDNTLIHQILELPDTETPFYLLLAGHPR